MSNLSCKVDVEFPINNTPSNPYRTWSLQDPACRLCVRFRAEGISIAQKAEHMLQMIDSRMLARFW